MDRARSGTQQQQPPPPPPPPPLERNKLRLFNSLTRKKEVFVPNEQRTIKWYCCGPTVYDVAHLGHARCYITFDIIRRILSDYFGYNIVYVMNITDIDDKIIKRARSNHLYEKYVDKLYGDLSNINPSDPDTNRLSLLDDIKVAIENYKKRRADEQDADKLAMFHNIITCSVSALQKLQNLALSSEFEQPSPNARAEFRQLCTGLKDVIADEQDSLLAHTINDHEIFKNLTLDFEEQFHEDMQRLDILPPSALTRVSEFIDETGAYIKKLEQNGYAYRSNGSIYFDTEKFDSSDKHTYAKLVREAYGQKKDLDEGEGELSASHQDKKKSQNDFALWKKSKIGEPSWQTEDFDAGRPGWHIECSVMASKLLGENIDIHTGGHDLRFPHHDNEIAQAEAYYDTGKNWVNYFLHSGHLTISGCKMSKSLKNFITIRQALQDYTSRQLRFAFLAHGWTETLDYSPNTMNTALSYEKTFREFFLNTSDTLRRQLSMPAHQEGDSRMGAGICKQFIKWSENDHQLNRELLNCVDLVCNALCDNLDTRTALNHLSCLVKECNKRTNINAILLKDIAIYIKHILTIFGTNFDESDLVKSFAISSEPNTAHAKNSSKPENSAMKYIETLAQFRADVRKISKGANAEESIQQILNLCDNIRDQTLPNLGIRLEDRETSNVPYVVKLVDRETLARERALAEKKEQDKKLKEETQRLEKLKIQQQREEKARLPPNEMFTSQTDKYSKFDDTGMPTHDSTGKELSKSALKKLQRLYAEQEARYNKYIESMKSSSQ